MTKQVRITNEETDKSKTVYFETYSPKGDLMLAEVLASGESTTVTLHDGMPELLIKH